MSSYDLIISLLLIIYILLLVRNIDLYKNLDLLAVIFLVIIVQVGIGSLLIDKVIVNSVQKSASQFGYEQTKLATIYCLMALSLSELILMPARRAFAVITVEATLLRFNAMSFLLVLLILTFLSVTIFSGFPQKDLVAGLTASELASIRVNELHSSSNIGVLIKNALGFNFSILMTFLSYVIYRESNRGYVYFLIALYISIYFATFDLSKSKVIWLLVGVFAIKLRYDCLLLGRRNLFPVLLGFFVFFTLLVLLFIFTLPHLNMFEITKYLSSRIVISQISGAPHFFDYDFDAGKVLVNHVLEAMQLGNYDAPGQIIMQKVFPIQFALGEMNYISIPAIYEAVSVFGFLLGTLMFAGSYTALRVLFLLREKSNKNQRIFFTVIASYSICNSNLSSSILPFIFSIIPLIPVILYLATHNSKFYRNFNLKIMSPHGAK
jgi:hypothetical protein